VGETFRILILICPLVFLAGIIDAVAGGGGLITLPAYMIAGLPPHMATATNKCGSTFGTVFATIRFLKGGKIHLESSVCAAVAALAGSTLGARLNLLVSEKFLSYIMLIVVPVMAVFLLLKRDFGTEDHSDTLSRGVLMGAAAGIGLVIGTYDGFFGPGAGTFLTLAFARICRFDLLTSSGNTKMVNAASNAAALVTFALSGQVIWAIGLPAALCSIAGNYVGASLALKKSAKIIRPMLFVVMGLLVLRLAYNIFFK